MEEKNEIYFISDAHLGIDLKNAESREKDLLNFLKKITPKTAKLFILGDLFDFWIDYKHAIRPCYIPILAQFREMVSSGVSIYYIAGNHDFVLGNFLEKEIGINIIFDDLSVEIQEKKVYLCHGDGVIAGDFGYKVLKKLLRNRLLQWCYKLLHPNIGVPLGTLFSGSSRHFSFGSFKVKREKQYLDAADGFLNKNHDIVLMGHTHIAAIYKRKNGIYCNTGEWMRSYSFAKISNGELSLYRALPGEDFQKVAFI